MKPIVEQKFAPFVVSILLSLWILAGCSSTPTAKDFAKEEAAVTKVRAEAEADRQVVAQRAAEAYLSSVPQWVLEPPRPDSEGIYGIGIADAKKVDTALAKAKLKAEFELAKQYKQQISGSERLYEEDRGRGAPAEKYLQLIDNLVDQVPIIGYETVKSQIAPVGGVYHAYVLLKMPYDTYNRVLETQRSTATDTVAQDAFADLERRLDKLHKERAAKERVTDQAALEALAEKDVAAHSPNGTTPTVQ